ncbi:MAG: alpha/beta fold hydrolase, partial [Bacteroidota bacterium]
MEDKGYLKLEENQSIYFEHIGDPSQPSFIFLHGGPGLGFNEKDKELFDFSKCNVIFYDQRGSNRSQPLGDLSANTSSRLVQDLESITKQFNIPKPYLVGGSWGSTLALLYAMPHPGAVRGMVLRGLFLADQASRVDFETGKVKDRFPKIWKRFRNRFKAYPDHQVMEQYHKQILNHSANSEELSLELNLYGGSINAPAMDTEALVTK